MADEGLPAYYETSSSAHHLKSYGVGDDHIVTAEELKTPLSYNDTATYHKEQESCTVFPNTIESKYVQHLLKDIINSSLLTQDDLLLLEVTLNDPVVQSNNESNYYTVALPVVLVAIIWYLFPVLYAILIGTVIGIGFTVYKLNMKRSKDRLTGQYNSLKLYLQEMESLLIVLMKSLQTVKERELVYKGFTKSVSGVPAVQVERSDYQCIPLRERIEQICTKGRTMIHSITHHLVEEYILNMELDNKDSYLAYRTMDTLNDDPLSLDNIKNSASLLAISNSEMLRRFALLLGHEMIPLKYDNYTILTLSKASDVLKPLLMFVQQSHSQLKWAIKYQHQYLLKEGSLPYCVSNVPVEQVNDDLHIADLHVHTTLIKLRQLNENNSSRDTSVEEIESILSNINTAQYHLKQVLHKYCPPPSQPIITPTTSISLETGEERKQVTVEVEETEEEEKIYEAYTTASIDQLSLIEEEHIVDNKEWKKTTLTVLRELQSVLVNRKLQKEKRKTKSTDDHETERKESTDDHETERKKSTDDHETEGKESTDDHETAIMDIQLMKAVALRVKKQKNEDTFEYTDEQ